ncbi:MAG TPA: TonB-dependent receptor [Candidatus Methylacidiphilales bacterium]
MRSPSFASLRSTAFLGAVLAAVLAAAPARAQSQAQPLPEVVVVGQGPAAGPAGADGLSPSAASADARRLRELAVFSPQDLGGLAPNLETREGAGGAFGSVTGARGLANAIYFTNPAVVYYVDDVPGAGSPMNVFDLHSVSTLAFHPGSQADVFGENAPGGVIDVRQSQPGDVFGARAEGGYGSFDRRDAFAEVTGPLSLPDGYGKLALLGSGYVTARDGYVRNTTLGICSDDAEEVGGRLALRYRPSKDSPWQVDVQASRIDDTDGAPRYTSLSTPRYVVASRIEGSGDLRNEVESIRLRHAGDEVETTVIASHRSVLVDPERVDFGFGGPSVVGTLVNRRDQYTGELRLAPADKSGFLSWRAGALYQHVDSDAQTATSSAFVNTLLASSTRTDTVALLGAAILRPARDVTLTLGNRLEADMQSLDRADSGTFGRGAARREGTWANAAPKAELAWDATKEIRAFASSGLAFRPGGFGAFPASSPGGGLSPVTYDTERTWENQIGATWTAPDRKVKVGGTLFWNESYDYQMEVYGFPNSATVNVPETAARGAEATFEVEPADGLTLRSAVGCTYATYVRYTDLASGKDASGLNVPYIPRGTFLLEATYRHPVGWFVHGDVRGMGNTDFAPNNGALYRQDAYALLGARIGYETPHWSVALYGENLADKGYDVFVDAGVKARISGDPRTFGVEAKVNW